MIGTQPTGAIPGVVLTMAAHTGLIATVDGKPARLAIVGEDGQIIAAGDDVAREAESVAVNSYRAFLKAQGHLRVVSKPLTTIENTTGVKAA